jgi:hypothetical protein
VIAPYAQNFLDVVGNANTHAARTRTGAREALSRRRDRNAKRHD